MAQDLPEETRALVRSISPEISKDLERLRSVKNAKLPTDSEASDKEAVDLTWLGLFEYQGTRLDAEEIMTVITYLKNGMIDKPKSVGGRQEALVLARPQVQAALHQATEHALRQWEINPSKILRNMHSILEGNITDFCDVNPAGITLKDLNTLPKHLTAAIQEVHEIRNAQGTQVKIKLYDKLPMINACIRLLDMNPAQKVEVTVSGLEERLNEALKRVPLEIEGELVNE